MFTGIVEEVGVLRQAARQWLDLTAAGTAARLKPGDSVSVSGVCLTATRVQGESFRVDISAETLSKTTLGRLQAGQRVNLETALTLDRPLGGHLLLGHVDCVGRVGEVRQRPDAWRVRVDFPAEFGAWVVARGSLGVDGISLTVAELSGAGVHLALIPHTLAQTTLCQVRAGQEVNLEFDILGKYVTRYLELRQSGAAAPLTLDRLKDLGY